MTVSSSFTDKVYQISGSSTIYPWGQDLDTQYGSLVVTEETNMTDREVVTTFVEGTDYNVVDKNVVFATAPSDTSHYIRITRNTYKGQPVRFNEGEDFPAEDFEHSLDRLAMIAQEQAKGLADEANARAGADEDLQDNIDAEALARETADDVLEGKITAEKNRAEGVEGKLSNLTTTAKDNLVAAINELDGALDTFGDIVTHNADEFATASQGAKADSAVQPTDLAGVATSGSYNDLDDTPTIPDAQIQSDWNQNDNSKKDFIKNKPTIGNGTITVKQDNEVVGTFTTNQSGNTTINLTGGGSGGGNDNIYTTALVTFQANNASASLDLSAIVDANTLYVPYVFADSQYTENLDHTAIYQKSSKTLTLYRDSRFISSSLSFTAYVTLVATGAQNIDTAAGYTTGQYYTEYNRSYSKSEADTLLSGKLDKVTTVTSGSQLYQKNPDGTQSMANVVTGSAAANTIPLRTPTGTLRTATPTDNNDATNKSYVDNLADTQNGTVSQCVTYTPDNLILEISGTTFTAKSGSVITMAGSTYSTVTLTADKTITLAATTEGKYQMFYQSGAIRTERILSDITSGNTASIPATFINTTLYFNTDNKLIYHKGSGTSGEVWTDCSYPLCTLELKNGVWSFAKDSEGSEYIFSTCGWVGHHIFTFPSPKYLSGNGKTNGQLASYNNAVNSVAISEMSATTLTDDWFKAIVIRGNNNSVAGHIPCRNVQHFSELLQQSARLQYVADDNIAYAYSSGGWQPQSRLFYIRYEYDGTDVKEFIMPRPYKGARNLLTDEIESQIGDIDTALTTIIGA